MSHGTLHAFFRTTLATVLVVATAAPPARSQSGVPDGASSPVLAPGQRVRVTAASPAFTGMAVGNLVKIGPDNLILVDAERGLVAELPRTSITRVEVGHQRRQTKKWLLIGLGVGGLGALAVWGVSGDEGFCGTLEEPAPCSGGQKVALSAVALGFYGGLGAFIGHRKKTDHWTDAWMQDWKPPAADLTWQVSPTLSRGARGAGLRLQLTW